MEEGSDISISKLLEPDITETESAEEDPQDTQSQSI